MSNKKSVAKSTLILIILGLISKPLGFVREVLIGAKFGASSSIDTYIIALASINLFSGLVSRTINTTLIPILTEIEYKEGKKGKLNHVSNFINILVIFSIFIMFIAFIFAPFIVNIVAPGFEYEQFNLTIKLVRIGIPTLVFNSIQGVLLGYIQTEGRFSEVAGIGIFINFVYIFYLLIFSNLYGVIGLMVSSVIGSILQILYIYIGARKTDYRYSFVLNFKDEYILKLAKLIPPIIVSVGIADLNSIIDRSMGSKLVEGSISALNYADKMVGLVTGLFATAISTVMFPIFSEEANKEDKTGFNNTITQSLNLILIITVPAVLAMMVLSEEIVIVVYERGLFDRVATIMTSGALLYSAIKILTMSTNIILNNIFYSLQDTRTPLYISVVSVITNVFLNIILISPLKHLGLAIATSASSVLISILSLYIIRKKIGPFGFKKTLIVGIKVVISSLIMIVIVYFANRYLLNIIGMTSKGYLLSLSISIIIGIILYLILIYLLKVEELLWFINLLTKRKN